MSPLLARSLSIALALVPATALAHSGRSISYSELTVRGTEVRAGLRLAAEDLIEVLSLDLDRDGELTASEMEASKTLLFDYLRNNLILQARDEPVGDAPGRLHPCTPTLTGISPPEPGDERLRWRVELLYRCGDCTGAPHCGGARGPEACEALPECRYSPASVIDLAVRSTVFQGGAFAHQHHATARLGGIARVLFFDARTQEGSVVVPIWTQVGGYLLHGIHHILSGYDHLVFLVALLLLGGSFRTLVKIVTSFTVAHSITLILGGLDLVTLPTVLVESAIALTIAYVGAENLFLRNPDKRWILTFFLGLVHGFGFAGALSETGLPTRGFVLTLSTFNIGVELGQVAVVALAWPLVRWLRKQRAGPAVVKALSIAILLTGLTLFVLRAFFDVG